MNMGNAVGFPKMFNFRGPDSDSDVALSSSSSSSSSDNRDDDVNEDFKTDNMNNPLHTYGGSSDSLSQCSSEDENISRHNNQTDSRTHMFSSNTKITLECIHELEKDLEFSDMVSLIFLVYEGLIGLQEMHTAILGGVKGFEGKLSKWAASNEPNWTMKLIEAIAVTQNYRVLHKLGYSKSEINIHFLPSLDASLYLNRTKKVLYRLCEFLTPEQSKELIELVRADTAASCYSQGDITLNCDPRYLEFPILFWISRGYINVDGEVNLKNLTKHLKVMDLLDKAEEIENMVKQMASLKSDKTNSNVVDNITPNPFKGAKRKASSINDDYPLIDPGNPGLVIIINNIKFKGNEEKKQELKDHYGTGLQLDAPLLEDRKGSEKDVERLMETFYELSFTVKVKDDVASYHMEKEIQRLVQENFLPNVHSALFLCILSHGAQGVIYGSNSVPVPIHVIQDAVSGPTGGCIKELLTNIPKVIIIQACQGSEKLFAEPVKKKGLGSSLVNSRRLHVDSADLRCDGPNSIKYRDMLICMAVIEGFVAIRSVSKGTEYIQVLCEKIRDFHQTEHFVDIVTKVHRELNNKEMHQQLQPWVQGNCHKHRGCDCLCMTPILHHTFRGKLFLYPINKS